MDMASQTLASNYVSCFVSKTAAASNAASSKNLSYEMPTHLHAIAADYHNHVAHLQKLQD